MMRTYSIGELAKRAGVTPRTVDFYVEKGLLEPLPSAGAYRLFDEGHLVRLEAILRLKDLGLPLERIRQQLDETPPDAVEALVAGPGPSSALDYIAQLTSRSPEPRRSSRSRLPDRPWYRVEIAPGVELHYQETRGRERLQRIQRWIEEAQARLASLPPDQ
ncbi:MAG: MerR family transcriptional regulator [Dehalococcoidia bacterium]